MCGRASSTGGKVFRSIQWAIYTTTRHSLFMVWFSINGQNIDLPLWQIHFSRCWGAFWSLVQYLLWVERCPYGVGQHSVPLQCAQNVFSHGLIYWKWPEHWLMFMVILVFQVLALCPWYSIFHRWTGNWLEPVGTVCHCSGLRKCVFMVLSSKIARTFTCLHGKAVFPGVEKPSGAW